MDARDPRPTFQRFAALSKLLELELPEISEPEARAAWSRILVHADGIRQELEGLESYLEQHFAAPDVEEPRPVEITNEAIEATTIQIVTERPESLRAWLWVLFASPTVAALMADLTFPTASQLRALEQGSNVARVLVPDCRPQAHRAEQEP